MVQYDPRVDDYIEKSATYAKPILVHLRELMHLASPLITETIKWGFPHFDYKGTVCSMAAFKEHLGFGFWKSSLLHDPHGFFAGHKESAGSIGKITSLADLPPDEVLIDYIRRAIDLNEKGIKVAVKKDAKPPKAELEVPDDLIAAFKINTNAMQQFEQFSPSAKREYLEWLIDAKSADTRAKRLTTMMEWVAEGKTRHWKYK